MSVQNGINSDRVYNIHRALKENIKDMTLPRYFGIAEDVLQNLVKRVAREEGRLSLDAVCAQLQVLPSDLRAELLNSGTMFESILLDVRRHFGLQFVMSLRGSDEIARILDYDDANQFDAAFSTWMGVPPKQFQQYFGGDKLSFLGAVRGAS